MSSPATVSASELQDPHEGALLFLDVRAPVEFGISHIPGSVNAPPWLSPRSTPGRSGSYYPATPW